MLFDKNVVVVCFFSNRLMLTRPPFQLCMHKFRDGLGRSLKIEAIFLLYNHYTSSHSVFQ